MSRSPEPRRNGRARDRIPAVVIVVVLFRTIILMSVVSVALVLVAHGHDASTVSSFLAVVIAAALTAGAQLTRDALAKTAG